MPNFKQHTRQAGKNLEFLAFVNSHKPEVLDWQITIGYYTGLHLVNAHLATSAGLHFSSHNQVDAHIAPQSLLANGQARLPLDIFQAYRTLTNFSRLSRYLSNDGKNEKAVSLSPEDLYRSLVCLDRLLAYFLKQYQFEMPSIEMTCPFNGKHTFLQIQLRNGSAGGA
jgi:hypothetical protein